MGRGTRSQGAGNRPAIYLSIILATAGSAFLYELRTKGVFACDGAGYDESHYLSYCNSIGYGDYDHGALWFGLEADALEAAAEADVLFLGSSRMQFAFSTDATRDWFSGRDWNYFLLGFSHNGNAKFLGPLLESMNPRAAAYVINVDRFFEERESEPVAYIFHTEDADSRYRTKQIWQIPHELLCKRFSLLCGGERSYFRDNRNGSWKFYSNEPRILEMVADADPQSSASIDHEIDMARDFVDSLPVDRKCIFLTVAPSTATPRSLANAIAASLEMDLTAPSRPEFRTFDGSHLDELSAQSWSYDFLALIGNKLDSCVRESRRRRPDSLPLESTE